MSTTHFGYQSVDETEKARRVRSVFDLVAPKYDLMNDLMSLGCTGPGRPTPSWWLMCVRGTGCWTLPGGTGDLALAFARKVGKTGQVLHTDINEAMLMTGRERLLDAGVVLPTVVCDAEHLPFADGVLSTG